MAEIKLKSAEIAAKWWSERITIVGQNLNNPFDGEMISPSTELLRRFEEYLAMKIQTTLLEQIDELLIGTGSGPDTFLGEVAKNCSIDFRLFPKNMNMWITTGTVKVKRNDDIHAKQIYP